MMKNEYNNEVKLSKGVFEYAKAKSYAKSKGFIDKQLKENGELKRSLKTGLLISRRITQIIFKP
jgi:hypothetical protein